MSEEPLQKEALSATSTAKRASFSRSDSFQGGRVSFQHRLKLRALHNSRGLCSTPRRTACQVAESALSCGRHAGSEEKGSEEESIAGGIPIREIFHIDSPIPDLIPDAVYGVHGP